MLKRLKIKNFKCFTNFETTFDKITFIKGANGKGKSTLGTDSYLLLVFGYSKRNLTDLPTRNVSKSLEIEGDIEENGDLYNIVRHIPTKLTIKKNGELLKFSNGTEAQRYLNNIFGDINSFKKFRMIDSDIGVNFLEEGQVALKKILFSVSESTFNNIRDRLGKMKRDRDLLNKGRVVLSKHYPSEKRLNVLLEAIEELEIKIAPLTAERNKVQNELRGYERSIGSSTSQINKVDREIYSLNQENKCYTCNQKNPSKKKSSGRGYSKSPEDKEQIRRLSVLRAVAEAVQVMTGQLGVNDIDILGTMMETLYDKFYEKVSETKKG